MIVRVVALARASTASSLRAFRGSTAEMEALIYVRRLLDEPHYSHVEIRIDKDKS